MAEARKPDDKPAETPAASVKPDPEQAKLDKQAERLEEKAEDVQAKADTLAAEAEQAAAKAEDYNEPRVPRCPECNERMEPYRGENPHKQSTAFCEQHGRHTVRRGRVVD